MNAYARDFAYSILLTALLILGKAMVEGWEFGRQLEQMTYNLLQLRLLSSASHADLPITIVDINNLVPVPVAHAGGTELVTPRDPMLQIVRAIAAHRPRAIGIDVNFSPGPDGYLTPADPSFLSACLQIRQGRVPVYVGIYDSVVLEPAQWLGRPEFEPLAAYITIPLPEHTEPATRMIEWVQPKGVSRRCVSLSYALADTDRREVPRSLAWAVERTTLHGEQEFSASEFLIDYAPLDQLLAQRVIVDTAADVAKAGGRIAGKIVLVGKATPGRTTDQFSVPGRGMPVPGVLLHASAAFTLLQAPLFRLTHAGRALADFGAALLVFGPVLLLGVGWRSWTGSDLPAHRLHAAITVAVVFAVIAVGHFLVTSLRLIWTDYLMVVGALLLHSPVERRIGASAGWVRRHLPRAGRRPGTQGKEQLHDSGCAGGVDAGSSGDPAVAASGGDGRPADRSDPGSQGPGAPADPS